MVWLLVAVYTGCRGYNGFMGVAMITVMDKPVKSILTHWPFGIGLEKSITPLVLCTVDEQVVW